MLMKVLRAELKGYHHIRSQFENPHSRRMMGYKLLIFTVFFSMMAIENTFRVMNWTFQWSFPIPDKRPSTLDFSSDYDPTYSEAQRAKYTKRTLCGPGALVQTQLVMWLMIANSLLWVKSKNFSVLRHTLHYFAAVALLNLYIPRQDWFPTMQNPKFALTNMNIFIFQIVLGMIGGLTPTHQFISLVVTMIYQVLCIKIWYDVKLTPICVWDCYLHMFLPAFMMVALGYLGAKDRI